MMSLKGTNKFGVKKFESFIFDCKFKWNNKQILSKQTVKNNTQIINYSREKLFSAA
jgi:hypothetical protein